MAAVGRRGCGRALRCITRVEVWVGPWPSLRLGAQVRWCRRGDPASRPPSACSRVRHSQGTRQQSHAAKARAERKQGGQGKGVRPPAPAHLFHRRHQGPQLSDVVGRQQAQFAQQLRGGRGGWAVLEMSV
jgi:hypothetical protein